MAGCSCLKRMAIYIYIYIYRLVREEAETAIYKCDDNVKNMCMHKYAVVSGFLSPNPKP